MKKIFKKITIGITTVFAGTLMFAGLAERNENIVDAATTDCIMKQAHLSNYFYNTKVGRHDIEKITITTTNVVPSGVVGSKDVSEKQNGSVKAWWFDEDKDGYYEMVIGQKGGVKANKCADDMFSCIGSMDNDSSTLVGINNLDVSNTTSMRYMFSYFGRKSMKSLSLGNFDTSKVTDMEGMFSQCGEYSMTKFSLGTKFDTSNVTNMEGMFKSFGKENLLKLNLGSLFNTSNVTNMDSMFYDCGSEAMETFVMGTKFNTLKVTNMCHTFDNFGNKKLTSLNLGTLFDTRNVTDMSYMFYNCGSENMTSFVIGSKFYTNKVTDMSLMFAYCGWKKLTSFNLGSKFNTKNVTNMKGMFRNFGEYSLTSLNLGELFDTAKVTDMSYMFYWCGRCKLKTLYLGPGFTTAKVTTYSNMFTDCGSSTLTTLDLGKITNRSIITQLSLSSALTLYMDNAANVTSLKSYFTTKYSTAAKRPKVLCSAVPTMTADYNKLEVGNAATFKMSGASGTYKFVLVNKKNSSETVLQNYGTSASLKYTFNLIGDYAVYGYVKNANGIIRKSKEYVISVVEKKVILESPLCMSLSFADGTRKAEINVGDKITVKASVTGGKGTSVTYKYRFLIFNQDTKESFYLTDYTNSNTYTWTALSEGNRDISVEIVDSEGTVAVDNSLMELSKVNVNVVKQNSDLSVTGTCQNYFTAVGTKTAFFCIAKGGSGSYTYSYLTHNLDTGSWYRFSDFTSESKLIWTASSEGNREFFVEVKDSNGTVARSKAINVVTSKEYKDLRVIANSNNENPSVGESIKLSAEAVGGSGEYTYSYLVHNTTNGSWYRFSGFTDENTLLWTASSAGNREFFVEVKDGNGNVVRSAAEIVEVK